jgi:hypothetical protein
MIQGQKRTFGVTGKLYRNNLVLYDRESRSFWSQLRSQAITGPLTGALLRPVPAKLTTWEDWQRDHPASRVLSPATGYRRDYSHDPYQEHSAGQTKAVGIVFDGQAKIYPFRELARAGGLVNDEFAGRRLTVRFDRVSESVTVSDESGAAQPHYVVDAGSWMVFYPKSQRFRFRKEP